MRVSHFWICIALPFFGGTPPRLASPDSWCHSILHLNCPLYRVLLGRCVPLVRSTHHADLVHCLHLDHEGEPAPDEVPGLDWVLVVQVSMYSIKAVIFSPPHQQMKQALHTDPCCICSMLTYWSAIFLPKLPMYHLLVNSTHYVQLQNIKFWRWCLFPIS